MDSSYNNLGGMNIQNGTGDAVLTPSMNGDKPKKRLIVIVVILIVAAIVGVFVWLIASGRLFSDKGFDEYRNLVLYGDNSEIEYPTEDGLYAIQDIVNNRDEVYVEEYFDKIRDAETRVSGHTRDKHGEAMGIINLWMKIEFFYYFYDWDLVKIFEDDGRSAAEQFIEKKYELATNQNNTRLQQINQELLGLELLYLDYIEAYESNGCKLSEYSETCSIHAQNLREGVLSNIDNQSSDILVEVYNLLPSALKAIFGVETDRG